MSIDLLEIGGVRSYKRSVMVAVVLGLLPVWGSGAVEFETELSRYVKKLVIAEANAAGPPTAQAATKVPGFYVSVTGSDANDGSFAHPFASLAQAQLAMEHSTIK